MCIYLAYIFFNKWLSILFYSLSDNISCSYVARLNTDHKVEALTENGTRIDISNGFVETTHCGTQTYENHHGDYDIEQKVSEVRSSSFDNIIEFSFIF